MVTTVLRVSLLLAVLRMTDGQSTNSGDSQCSYTFKVPTAECGHNTVDDQFMKSSMIALQTQMKLLTAKYTDDIRKLTEQNEKLHEKIASFETGFLGDRNRSSNNLKQCSSGALDDDKEYGIVFTCDFVKKRDDSVLRIVWNGDIRLIHYNPKPASCRRWFFTINWNECKHPRTIDMQLHVTDTDSNNHRPAYVEGYCRGIAAGDVKVAWNVGDGGHETCGTGNSYTGWGASVRIIIEEVDVENAATVIV